MPHGNAPVGRAVAANGPWSDAIPSVTLAGYAVPIRRDD
jgi:hypothetical protein